MADFSLAASIQNAGRALLRIVFDVKVEYEGEEPQGAAIWAANHMGWLDGPLILLAAKRPLHVLAKAELWESGFGPFVRAGSALPTHWKDADRAVLHEARRLLDDQKAIGIFPEGTRCRGDFSHSRAGTAYLLAHTHAELVPVAILGTRPTGKGKGYVPPPGSPIRILVGRTHTAEELGAVGVDTSAWQELEQLNARVRAVLREHVQRAVGRFGMQLPEDDPSRAEDFDV